MFRITAAVEWIDEEVCVTHIGGHNLPTEVIEPLMEWVLALELGCGIEELGRRGWEARPEGPEVAEPNEWVLDWNRAAEGSAPDWYLSPGIAAPDGLPDRFERGER
jgi:ribose 5-phosphate isomerase